MFGVPDFLSVVILLVMTVLLLRNIRLHIEKARRKRIKVLLQTVRFEDDVCAICLKKPLFRCQSSSCGHTYCGDCILWYWDPNEAFTPCCCFLCEDPVTELSPDPVINLSEHVEVWRNVEQYNHLMVLGKNCLIKKVLALPLILKMVYSLMKMYGDYNTNLRMVFFAVHIDIILQFLSDLCPSLLPQGLLSPIVILYYGCTAYMVIMRAKWPTHVRALSVVALVCTLPVLELLFLSR